MDDIDIKILGILAEQSNISATDLAPLIGLSIPATNKRINKLARTNVIENFTIMVNAEKVGKPMLAFVFVVLERLTYSNHLTQVVGDDKDILECFAITGEYDYILKVCAKDMADLETKIAKIKEIRGVTQTNTIVSMTTHKHIPTVLPDSQE